VSPTGAVWLTGQGGQLWQLQNGRFTFVTPSVISDLLSDIRGIWSDGNGTVLASGGRYYRSVGGDWQQVPRASDVTAANGMWARSVTDAWAVGANAGVFHYDGVSWSRVATGVTAAQAANLQLFAIGGTDGGEIWAVGQRGQHPPYSGSSARRLLARVKSESVAAERPPDCAVSLTVPS
jgi:hypothetical protein